MACMGRNPGQGNVLDILQKCKFVEIEIRGLEVK
jgi:hypothetical protein